MAESVSPNTDIQILIDLISNTTEAYTVALFLADKPGGDLSLFAFQSLSQSIDPDVLIGPGEGLIGWVHKYSKPVNVDQFDQDTRNLLIYKTDESIKSFMAVPLPTVNGVLAVDSKQRYVFTEKSHKILNQFGQALEATLARIDRAAEGPRLSKVLTLVSDLDGILNQRDQTGRSLDQAINLIRTYADAAACFLVAVLPTDPSRMILLAQDPPMDLRLPQDNQPSDQGLIGWIIQNKKPLVLEKTRLDGDRSFIFYPEEPLEDLIGFIGYPLIFGGRMRGALLLAGEESHRLGKAEDLGLEPVAARMAARLEMEVLFQRVAELNRLDPQVGLPHRTYFTKRLTRMMDMASVQGIELTLLLIELANLGDVALEVGQEAAHEVLRAAARYMLANTRPDFELGHLSYGIIGLAVMGAFEDEEQAIIDGLAAEVADRPLEMIEGRARVEVRPAVVRYPAEVDRAEDMIQLGLVKLYLKPPLAEDRNGPL